MLEVLVLMCKLRLQILKLPNISTHCKIYDFSTYFRDERGRK